MAAHEAVPLQTSGSPGTRLRSGAIGLAGATMQAVATIAPAIAGLFFTQYVVSLTGVTAPLACLLGVCIVLMFYYLTQRRQEFNWILHIALPVISTGALIYVTIKSFQPFPSFPYNYAPLIDGVWFVIGLAILVYLWVTKRDAWIAKAGAASVDADVIPEVDDRA